MLLSDFIVSFLQTIYKKRRAYLYKKIIVWNKSAFFAKNRKEDFKHYKKSICRMEIMMTEVQKEKQAQMEKDYEEYVKKITPTHNLLLQMAKAFLTGGLICTLGQFLLNFAKNNLSMDQDMAGSFCSLILVLLSVLLTGFNLYPSIVKFGGAGALVPITGFANSVAAPAVEFKKEGQVFGIGCKIFTIAGPVILYGIFTSWLLGLFYFLYLFIL